MEILIIILGMLAAFYSGFYCGYLKREEKAPQMPIENITKGIKTTIDNVKNKKERPDKEKAKENSFFS
jgi:hypothetical protein